MQLERLRLFAELVNHGNFSRTAEALGVSKGYLSKQIKILEAELNNQLLIRNTRAMRLTNAGQALYEQASKLTSFWQDSIGLLEKSDDRLKGTVRFTAPTALVKHALLHELIKIRRQYPDINIICESGNQTHDLITVPFDFAIRITTTPPEDMIAKPLCQFDYVCCATPEYLSAHPKPASPEELTRHTCIALSYWNQWLFKTQEGNINIDVQAEYQFSDNEVLKQAALLSQGITRLPCYMIKNELAQGRLVALFQDIENLKKEIYILYPQVKKRPERVNLVIAALKDGLNDFVR